MQYDPRIDDILERNKAREIILKSVSGHSHRCVFVYGPSGCGKTTFVRNVLHEYDIIQYDSTDVRNAALINSIKDDLRCKRSVLNMFQTQQKTIMVLLDDVEGMNLGDRNGMSALTKLIRLGQNVNRIVCISTSQIDKKMSELIKHCEIIELSLPTIDQMNDIASMYITKDNDTILKCCGCNLRRFFAYMPYISIIDNIVPDTNIPFINVKDTVKMLLNSPDDFYKIVFNTNDAHRSIISLLWYENIVDHLKKDNFIKQYLSVLNNLCWGDIIDRTTFQRQIWQLNELSFYIKLALDYKNLSIIPLNQEIRFTKVLTKYSCEFNNNTFLLDLCNRLHISRKKLLRLANTGVEMTYLSPIEYKRLIRFINKHEVKRSAYKSDELNTS